MDLPSTFRSPGSLAECRVQQHPAGSRGKGAGTMAGQPGRGGRISWRSGRISWRSGWTALRRGRIAWPAIGDILWYQRTLSTLPVADPESASSRR